MQNGEDKKLPPLPPSNDVFWAKAEKYQTKVEPRPKCEHSFIYKSGREVVCTKCNIGFYLTGKESVKEGHIYMNEEFVI